MFLSFIFFGVDYFKAKKMCILYIDLSDLGYLNLTLVFNFY